MIGVNNFSKLYTSVAAKETTDIPNFDVDYIFMFSIDNKDEYTTKINYSVALINTNLTEDFSALKDRDGKLKGSIILDKIYIIH